MYRQQLKAGHKVTKHTCAVHNYGQLVQPFKQCTHEGIRGETRRN